MSFTNHDDVLFDPGKPVLGDTGRETRDNLVAVAAGDNTGDTVPRIESSALQPSVLDIGGTVSTDYEFAGMFGTFHVRGNATSGGGTSRAQIRYRTATDGGSTPTGWTDLLNVGGLAASTEYNFAIAVNETFPAGTNWVEMTDNHNLYAATSQVAAVLAYGAVPS